MSTIVRNARDIEAADRVALEHVVGEELREDQQVIIQVVETTATNGESKPGIDRSRIPGWWNVYEGLSDAEIEETDAAIRQRCNLTREFPPSPE